MTFLNGNAIHADGKTFNQCKSNSNKRWSHRLPSQEAATVDRFLFIHLELLKNLSTNGPVPYTLLWVIVGLLFLHLFSQLCSYS